MIWLPFVRAKDRAAARRSLAECARRLETLRQQLVAMRGQATRAYLSESGASRLQTMLDSARHELRAAQRQLDEGLGSAGASRPADDHADYRALSDHELIAQQRAALKCV